MALSIDRLFAYIAIDDEGEGVCGALIGPGGSWMPLVGADMERVEQLRPVAQMIADQSGKRIVLAHFEKREDVEYIEPLLPNPFKRP